MAESLQNLKRRLSGVKNINQITRAMELVAATKMRKSQEIALASRPYAYAAFEMLGNLDRIEHVKLPPIFDHREVKRTAVVLVTSDKGLAGAFNANVIRNFDKFFAAEFADVSPDSLTYIAIGQKAINYFEKKTGLKCAKFTPLETSRPGAAAAVPKGQSGSLTGFTRVGDFTTVEQILPVANLLIDGFLKGDWDRVMIFSTNFRSALAQDVIKHEIFPIDIQKIRQTAEETIPKTGRYAELRAKGELGLLNHSSKPEEYIIEPAPAEILEDLGRHLVLMQIYHLILEANASEHAARRTAMKNASDNASDLASALSLEYNKSRQALITREIIEIVAGSEAL